MKKGIVHLERTIASGEINGDGLIVPEDLAMADFEAIDGKSKKSLDGSLAGNDPGLSLGIISRAIRIESDVDDGAIEDDLVEAELGAEKRGDLQASHDAVHVREGNLGGGLATMDSNSAHVDLEAKRSGMDAADFDPASGDALHFGDEAAADQRLE
jgi:hypothetical protein